jgi:hypothetical protein
MAIQHGHSTWPFNMTILKFSRLGWTVNYILGKDETWSLKIDFIEWIVGRKPPHIVASCIRVLTAEGATRTVHLGLTPHHPPAISNKNINSGHVAQNATRSITSNGIIVQHEHFKVGELTDIRWNGSIELITIDK